MVLLKERNKILLLEVQNKSEVGRVYAEMQMEFIRWLVNQSKIIPYKNEEIKL